VLSFIYFKVLRLYEQPNIVSSKFKNGQNTNLSNK